MADSVKIGTGSLLQASDVASTLAPRTAPNGVRFAAFGDTRIADADLQRIVQAVPALVAPALVDRVFYFVPLAIPELRDGPDAPPSDVRDPDSGRTLIASDALPDFLDEAICHRNVAVAAGPLAPAHEGIFISARLLRDTFALAFEFFINVGHAFAEHAGIPDAFITLAWSQALAEVRGETSQDAFESRAAALLPRSEGGPKGFQPDEKARLDFLESAFADAIAIYQLSLAVDFDYAELREREYPLLAPAALADRLRLMAQLFPPNPGYEFSIRYRRRN
jgi:hypothetical protein